MMKKGWMYLMVLAAIFATACDDDDDGDDRNLAEADRDFIEGAAMSNLVEINFGTLAVSKGESEAVRNYGEMMVTEHTAAQSELQSLADDYRNVDWPDDLDDAHEELRQQLEDAEGARFDSLYLASQVNDHQMTLELFEAELVDGEHNDVKSYATKYKPHIEDHLAKADSLYNVIVNQADGQ